MMMKPIQILGVAVLAVGVVLLGFGYHASNAPMDQLSNTLTGRFTDQTMWYFGLGAAATIGGALLALFGKGK
jgi:drug/metabolite transporter (DMT)-like permease